MYFSRDGAEETSIIGELEVADAMADRFRIWFEYEQDAHAKVVRSLESVPVDAPIHRSTRKPSAGSLIWPWLDGSGSSGWA